MDGVGTYLTDRVWQGVWLSDQPLDINEGADGDTVLAVHVPEKVVKPYEWIEPLKGYREFLIPAKVVNRYGPPRGWEVFD